MTTFREEIFNLTFAYGEYVNDWEREQMTDKVLNLFEKRIDYVKNEGYANAGWVSACMRMKEEMFKE